MTALLLSSQDGEWQGLFINGHLLEEGHDLSDPKFWLDVGKKYGLDGCDLRSDEMGDEDDQILMECGNFPGKLSDLKGSYPR